MKIQHTVALSGLVGVAIGGLAIHGLHAQQAKPVLVVTEINLKNSSDKDAYMNEYVPKAMDFNKKQGVKYLTVGAKVEEVEGTAPMRVSVTEWESFDKYKQARQSDTFKSNKAIGDKYATFRTYVVEVTSP